MILVLGLGVVGKAAINYFRKLGKEVCFFDDRTRQMPLNFEDVLLFDTTSDEFWNRIELVVASPGFALKHDVIQEAFRRKIKVTNDIELFLDQNPSGQVIGITGTNGKSTACALLKHVLGDNAEIGGNFGRSPLDFSRADFYVLELSSYQLELMDIESLRKLRVGAIVNIYPNHIDRHGSFEDYISAKCKIFSAQSAVLGHCKLFEQWDIPKAKIPAILPKSKLFEQEEYKYCWGLIELILDELKFDKNLALQRAENYQPLPFRQQTIATKPITIINDSKSTNSIAVRQALRNAKNSVIWIAGGAGHSDWSELEEAECAKVKLAYLYGQSGQELQPMLEAKGIDYLMCKNLEEIVPKAIDFCIANKLDLLFSPGYASFDQFKNFEDRGSHFNAIVQSVLERIKNTEAE